MKLNKILMVVLTIGPMISVSCGSKGKRQKELTVKDGQSCTSTVLPTGVEVSCPGQNPIVIANGVNGTNGEDGVSVGFTSTTADPKMCAAGGNVIALWSDLNANNIYDKGEKNYREQIICNGVDAKGCIVERLNKFETRIACEGKAPVIIRDGTDGRDGQGCYVKKHPEGVALICGETVQIIRDGRNGDSCTVTPIPPMVQGPQQYKIQCGNTVQIIQDGQNGQDGTSGQSCTVITKPSGAIVIKCPNSVATIPPEKTVTVCMCKGIFRKGETKTYTVSYFVSKIMGKYDYSMGACRK